MPGPGGDTQDSYVPFGTPHAPHTGAALKTQSCQPRIDWAGPGLPRHRRAGWFEAPGPGEALGWDSVTRAMAKTDRG